MENNNELENVQIEEVNNDVVTDVVVMDDQYDQTDDLTRDLVLIGVGAAIGLAPLVYSKLLKPGFKKIFGKKKEDKVVEIVEETTVEEEAKEEPSKNEQ